LQSPQGYLLSGVTATLADQMGSAVIYSIGVGLSGEDFSGVGLSGVSLEISVSYLDTATVGVSETAISLSLSNTYKGF
jgi:acyl-coenzyme A thioesterase 13